ncbi:Antigen peptide transporter 2 [Merluccius polli]|uniref:Antigen peptide transporter 2 n=1 Tax=Merluccius polli TaxID=89951 RepID=A0AA47N1W5_MERPO|nr:Antigen peptide transporter 2 [Merluccius polli]
MKWRTYGCVLLWDMFFWLLLFTELVLFQCPSCGGLAGLWIFAIVKWILLYVWTLLLVDKPTAVLYRLVTLVCLLLPVVESGRSLLLLPVREDRGAAAAVPDLGVIVAAQVSAVLACALWELDLTDGHVKKGGAKKDGDGDDPWVLVARVLQYFMQDRLYLLCAFGSLILGAACESLIPLYQGRVMDMLRGQLYQAHFLRELGWLTLFSLGSSLFAALRGSTFMWVLARLNRRVKSLLYSSLLQQDIHFFEENQSGKLASRLHSDVDRMGRTVALNCNTIARSSIKSVLMLLLMVKLSWQLTLLTVLEMRLLSLLQSKYNTYSKEMKEQVQDCQAETNRLATQTIGSIRVVRSCRAERYEEKVYNQTQNHMCDIKRRKGNYSATFLLMNRMVNVVIKVLILVQGHTLVSSGQITVGNLLAFFLYQKPLSHSIQEFLSGTGDIASTAGVIAKVFSYLDRKPKRQQAGQLAPETLKGGISFQNVTFAYPSAPDQPVLKSLSMEIRPGKMTAIVGRTGEGKSSCVTLLKRLYEPQAGCILLDGLPLHSYNHKYLHQKVTLVSQNPVLFSGSVGYNIAYGLENCTPEMLEEAVKSTSASKFIASLEQKYDTDVGEGGVKLAAGQKQCVAIARALVRTPQVVILDEATSHLDIDIQQAVVTKMLLLGVTLLVVAHQKKTMERADHIILIEGGAVAEQGTHHDLLAKKGRYHRNYQELFD